MRPGEANGWRRGFGAGFLVLVCAGAAEAGAPHPSGPAALARGESIDVWRSGDGLPQNSVQCILQTRSGYLWLGTHEGLVRFDGTRFTVFDAAHEAGIENSYVWTLLEDHAGDLWIGTGGGGLTRYRDGTFVSFTVDGTAGGLPHDMVSSIVQRPDGGLWIGTYGGGLVGLKDGIFRGYAATKELRSQLIRTLLVDADGRLWIGTVGGGLHRFDPELGRVIGYGGDPQNVYALHQDRRGRLWIGTDQGLLRLDGDRLRRGFVGDLIVHAIHEDSLGNLWVGTDHGLRRLSADGVTSWGAGDGLSNEIVHAIHEDREGSLWIGTGGGGLNRLRRGPFSTLAAREGLSHDMVSVILEDGAGVLWIGTWGGGLNGFTGGVFRTWTTADGLSSNLVSALHQDERGELWVGTYDAGLNRLGRDGTIVTYSTRDGLAHDSVWAIGEGLAGAVWVGTSAGLSRIDEAGISSFGLDDGLSQANVRALLLDRQGVLWIGTNGGGLSRFADGRFTSLGRREGLSNDVVYAIHEDSRGVLWIGTYGGGLNRHSGGRFTAITTAQGLCDDTVLRILEDDAGDFWMSSNRGVFQVSRDEADAVAAGHAERLACTYFGTAAGMRSSECNGGLQPAGWKARDGRLWFPTTAGAAVVDPGAARSDRPAPPVVVEAVIADRRLLDPGQPALLAPGTRDVELHYTALSFLDPGRVRFRYRLEGYDDEWVDAGTRRQAYYTNLPPGEYRFGVQASNDDGAWNEGGAAYAFRLRPRLWQTDWFVALCTVSAIGAAGGLYLVRVRTLKHREHELARVVDERTRDLVEATHRLREANRRQADVVSRVSHELKTPLTLIHLYGETLQNDAHLGDAERREYCSVITREVARLGHLIDRVLGFASVDRGRKQYHLRHGDLRQALAPTVEAYARYLGGQGFSVRSELAADLPPVRFDPEAVAEAVVNLIDNAAKYGGASREIDVRLFARNGAAVLEIEDRGVGIAPEQRERIFEQFYRVPDGGSRGGGHGLGLFLVRHIAEAHQASIELDSEIGRGSRFRLVFPSRPDGGAG